MYTVKFGLRFFFKNLDMSHCSTIISWKTKRLSFVCWIKLTSSSKISWPYIRYLVFLYVALLHFADTAFFTSWSFVAILYQANLSAPFFSSSICSLHVSVPHFVNFHHILNPPPAKDYNLLKTKLMVSIFAIKIKYLLFLFFIFQGMYILIFLDIMLLYT